jgi:hypothetical protein
MGTDSNAINKKAKMHQTVSWGLIIGLFLLRIPLLGLIMNPLAAYYLK